MMNKLKNLFLLAVCAVVVGSAMNVSAQSNAQIDKVVQYYEWLFETQFSSAQRNAYREIKNEDYQNDPAGEKKGADDLIKNFSTIKSKSESEQERVRGTVLNSFIPDLRSMNDNREAEFLLSVYDAKQESDERAANENGAGDISAYAGKWVWSRTGSGVIIGGAYAGGNGSRFTYEFAANGGVKFTGIMNVMQGGCSQQVFQFREGKASVSGNNLTISWQPEKFTRDFSCDTGGNYTKTLPAKVEKLKVSFKNNSTGQRQMCVLGSECFTETR